MGRPCANAQISLHTAVSSVHVAIALIVGIAHLKQARIECVFIVCCTASPSHWGTGGESRSPFSSGASNLRQSSDSCSSSLAHISVLASLTAA